MHGIGEPAALFRACNENDTCMQGVKRKTGDAAGANAAEGDVTVGMWHNIFNNDLKISG